MRRRYMGNTRSRFDQIVAIAAIDNNAGSPDSKILNVLKGDVPAYASEYFTSDSFKPIYSSTESPATIKIGTQTTWNVLFVYTEENIAGLWLYEVVGVWGKFLMCFQRGVGDNGSRVALSDLGYKQICMVNQYNMLYINV